MRFCTGITAWRSDTLGGGTNKIVDLALPDTVVTLAAGAFPVEKYPELKYVYGAEVTRIDKRAFKGLPELERATFLKVGSIGESAFENCLQIQYINFLDVRVTVGVRTFASCTRLSGITLRTARIGDRAFDGCRALRFLDLYALPEATLGNSVFANTAGGAYPLTIRPCGVIVDYAARWGTVLDTPAGGNPAIYGAGHKQITIRLTN